MERADVVVVGAGLIGSAVAWRLAQAGLRVVLLDRGEPGQEASWAGAGLLQPEAGREASPELLRLWLESLAMYGDFIRELREATSADVEFRLCGRLVLALDTAEEAALHQRAEAQRAAGIPCEWLTAAEVRRREPAVTPDVRAALYFPQHGLVDNRRLVRILALAAAMAGAHVRGYEPAVAIATRGGRVEGVATANGRIAADVVVNAAGCWAGQLLPERWPSLGGEESPSPIIGPAKGEIIALEAQPRPLAHVVSTRDASVSARADGRIVVGATVIHGTFDRQVSVDGLTRLLTAATTAVPALRTARFVEAWTGLRPYTPDEQPILGPDEITGLYWATGHYKMGILSTPATAAVVADLVAGRSPRMPISSMSPRRFAR
ncbi:MAG: glycine oxidase ThiO [Chloroflexi bacterium]|nr:glycine oxidase ThiO [Chloroflexota bacterium]